MGIRVIGGCSAQEFHFVHTLSIKSIKRNTQDLHEAVFMLLASKGVDVAYNVVRSKDSIEKSLITIQIVDSDVDYIFSGISENVCEIYENTFTKANHQLFRDPVMFVGYSRRVRGAYYLTNMMFDHLTMSLVTPTWITAELSGGISETVHRNFPAGIFPSLVELISREDLYRYTNGRFLFNEQDARNRRYINFDVDQLCAIASSTSGQYSPVHAIKKMEGGFSKALLMQKEDGSEVVAKIPFPIAGPPKYTTAAEVAILEYVHENTQVPVPKVLAWSCDPSNPVGAEYIIMEKAPGVQLFEKWGDMAEYDQFCLVKHLTRLEGGLAAIQFPGSGSLYLRETLAEGEEFEALDPEVDTLGRFCVGPSCQREWRFDDTARSSGIHNNAGPWTKLGSYGTALVERELGRVKTKQLTAKLGPPRGSPEEQIAVLNMAKAVMPRLDFGTLIDKVSQPVLWHTDLHMGNIYVSEEDPTKIVSLIDWQSIVIAPLFLQARFPTFLSVDEDYTLGLEISKLPSNFDEMDDNDKEIAIFKLSEAKLAKAYELSNGSQNKQAYKALFIPTFLQELFVRCGEVSEEGVIPLRACLIEIFRAWDELEFSGPCPYHFDDDTIVRHDQEFQKYRDFHNVQEAARKYLETDTEGWISPYLDFAFKQDQDKELLELMICRCSDYNSTPEGIRNIWPFQERQ